MDSTLSNYYGRFYLYTGRPGFLLKGSAIFCIATFKLRNSECITREFYCTNITFHDRVLRNLHAEEVALFEVEKMEKAMNCIAVSVQLYSSLSPCGKCCMQIRGFLDYRPQCTLHIAFACLYWPSVDVNRYGLRVLNEHRNVRRLDVFTDQEWKLLEDRGCFTLLPYARYIMNVWDAYWRQQLIGIVTA